MNLVKRLFGHDGGSNGHHNVLVRRDRGGFFNRLRRADRPIEPLWCEFDEDPWAIIRDPWGMMDRMARRLERFAPWPAIDVSEDDDALTVRCDVPGLNEKDLSVEVSGNHLTISGQRDDEWEDRRRGMRWRERVSGHFTRTIPLPSYVDADRIEAKYRNGTLTITMPRIPGKGPKRVQIRAA